MDQDPTTGSSNTTWLLQHKKYFDQFKVLSGWQVTGKDRDGNDVWAHTAGDDAFASDYAKTNPDEDWAETFEQASRPGLDTSTLSTTLKKKVQLVKDFLNLVVPTNQALGNLQDELVNQFANS